MMKKIIIGLLALCSFSSFAGVDCKFYQNEQFIGETKDKVSAGVVGLVVDNVAVEYSMYNEEGPYLAISRKDSNGTYRLSSQVIGNLNDPTYKVELIDGEIKIICQKL